MAEPIPHPEEAGSFAFDGLDRVLHEKARLGILTSLLSHQEGLSFNALRELCSLTDGNLSRHLTILQEAQLIDVHKESGGRRPRTTVTLTPSGQQRFVDYLNLLEQIVQSALGNDGVVVPTPRIEFKTA